MAFSWDNEEHDLSKYTAGVDQAERFNQGKLNWDLMHLPSFEPMIRVLEFGAKKYSADNWKKGFPIREIYNSLMRHLIAFMNGEDNDPESGLPHIGHIQCNIMFLAHTFMNHPEFDNRLKRELQAKVISMSEKKKDNLVG